MLLFAPLSSFPPLPPPAPDPAPSIQRNIALSPSQLLGVLGSALLLLGLYLPFERGASGLAHGHLSEHGTGISEASVIVVMAVLSFVLALRQCCPALAATAMVSLMALASAALLTVGPFLVPAPTSQNTLCCVRPPALLQTVWRDGSPAPCVSPGWGWYLILAASMLLFVAAVLDDVLEARAPRRRPFAECPPPLDGPSPDCV